tara:strand:- start:2508 stop:9380 length:6873 start_codon:yes stop_codon:yes gene_type:complete
MSKLKVNINPYFDDFDESKGFQRILFRPNFSIQARELNQLQSILQDQISKLSGQFYQNGDYVRPGELTYTNNLSYITLSTDLTDAQISSLPGSIIGRTSGSRQIKCKVITATKRTGTDSATLFVTRVKSGLTDLVYSSGDVIYEVGGDGNQTATTVGTVGTYSGLTAPASGVTGKGSAVQVSGGVYYINGHFVYSADGILLLDKYTTTPTYRIGFSVAETAVNVDSDSTLYDNANGSPNYLAPGADRYKIALSLSKVSTTDTTDTVNQKFVELCRVVSGTLKEETDFISNSVDKDILGERDYEESGNYVKGDFDIEVREHLNTVSDANGIKGVYAAGGSTNGNEGKIAVGVFPGKASIKGSDVSITDKTYLAIDKARDTVSENETGASAIFGQYITTTGGICYANHTTTASDFNVDTGSGAYYGAVRNDWLDFASDIDTANHKHPFPTVLIVKENDENSLNTNTELGTLKIRNIQSNGDGEWNIYIFDINMNPGFELSDATALWSADSASGHTINGQNDSLKICGLSNPVLQGTANNTMIYDFPKSNISAISEIEISETIQTFDGAVGNGSGNIVLDVSDTTNEEWVQKLPDGITSARSKYSLYGPLLEGKTTTLGANLKAEASVSMTVASNTDFPEAGGIVKIGSEFIYYSRIVLTASTQIRGLVRGLWGSIPDDHLSTAVVTLVSTSFMLAGDENNNRNMKITHTDSNTITISALPTATAGMVIGAGNLYNSNPDLSNTLNGGSAGILPYQGNIFRNGTVLKIKRRRGAVTALAIEPSGDSAQGDAYQSAYPFLFADGGSGKGLIVAGTASGTTFTLSGSTYIVNGGHGYAVNDIVVARNPHNLDDPDGGAGEKAIYRVTAIENEIDDGADAIVKVIGYQAGIGHAYQVIDPGFGFSATVLNTNGNTDSLKGHAIEILHHPGGSIDPKLEEYLTITVGVLANDVPYSGAGNFINNGKYTVIGPVKHEDYSDARRITKTPTKSVETTSDRDTTRKGEIVLDKADGISKNFEVLMSSAYDSSSYTTNITSRYTFDGGQRDNFITNSKLILNDGEQFPTGRIQVTYWYFSHGSGKYATRASYPAHNYTISGWGSDSKWLYSDIPTYTASNGKVYRLSDSVDFRPVTSDTKSLNGYRAFDTGSSKSLIPNGTVKVGANGGTDKVSYYTSRIDKVFLDEEGNLGTVKGTPSIDPQYPSDPSNSIVLYNVKLDPYVHTTKDVSVEKVNNNKYENQEISLLEQRIENLETYNILSPLEQEAASYPLGQDRFMRGFITDPFIGHDKGDTNNKDYNIAVDGRKGLIRPAHSSKALALETESAVSTSLTTTGAMVHLPITSHTSEIFNLQSNTTDKIRNSDTTTFYGYLKLSPKFDRWKSTKSREFLASNKGGIFDSIKNLSDGEKTQGTIWNDWKTHWSGVRKSEIEFDNRQEIDRRHQRSSQMVRNKEHGLTTSSFGEKYVGTNYNPYIRSKTINIDAYGLKLNTTGVRVYFDDVEVTQDIVPDSNYFGTAWNGSGTSTLATYTDGTFQASYIIPNVDEGVSSANYSSTISKFPAGPRVIKVTADDSECKSYYNVSGIVDTKDIYATDIPEYSNDTYLKETLSQEFTVVDDMVATKVDLYFSAEPDSDNENFPVFVQLRKMVDGKPSNIVIPYSTKVLNVSDTSVDGTATTATFDSPIYLSKGKYCISFSTSSTGYSLSSLDTDLQGGSKSIYVGNMYRGTKRIPNRMIKFNLYRATFNTSPTYSQIGFDNAGTALPDEKLGKNPIWTTTDISGGSDLGNNKLRIMHYGHGFKVGDYLQLDGIVGTTVQVCDMGTQVNAEKFSVGDVVGNTLDNTVPELDKAHGIVVAVKDPSNTKIKVWLQTGSFSGGNTLYKSNTVSAAIAAGTIDEEKALNGIPLTLLNKSSNANNWFKVLTVENDSYTVQRTTSDGGNTGSGTDFTAYATGWAEEASNTVTVKEAHIKADMLYFVGNTIVPTNTDITWGYATGNPNSPSSYTGCQLNENVSLTSTQYIDDTTNRKVYFKGTFSSTNSRVSPLIDKDTLNAVLVQNLINKPTHQIGSGNQFVDIHKIYTSTQLTYRGQNGRYDEIEITDTATTKELWRNAKVGKFIRFAGNSDKLMLITDVHQYDAKITVDATYYNHNDLTSDFELDNTNNTTSSANWDILNYFVDEISPDSGSTVSAYVTKSIEIPSGANEIRVVGDVKMPIGSEIKVYVKMDTDNTQSFELTNYKQASVYGYKSLYGQMLDSDDDKYTEVDWGYFSNTTFSKFAVKVIFTGTESYKVPVIKNLKVMATYVI